jgi:hypothetical protein
MINFLKRVLASNEELAENVPFSCLVTIDEDKKSTQSVAELAEVSSYILVRACAYNINETELFQPFNLQDELVNLVGIMLHEHTTGVITLEGLNQKKGGSTNLYRKRYIAHFTGRLNAMLEGTSRIRNVNIHNRVLAAMYLISRPAVISALSRLTLRPLPEFFISSHRAWLWKRTGGPQAALVRQVFVCANCLAVAVLLGLVGCSRI